MSKIIETRLEGRYLEVNVRHDFIDMNIIDKEEGFDLHVQVEKSEFIEVFKELLNE